MTLRLRPHDLRRLHRARDGELCLALNRPERVDWTGCIDGYPTGVIAVVERRDIALPASLEVCAADAGLDLESHPMVPRLRALVAEALLCAHRSNAPQLIEQLSGYDVEWAPGAEAHVRSAEKRARQQVDVAVTELAGDLGARARRRRSHEIMYPTRRVSVAEPTRFTELLGSAAPSRPLEPLSDSRLRELAADVARARALDMPQRLPNGVRRALFSLDPGVYLSEDGVLSPRASLREAIEAARHPEARSKERAVVDWDGDWPVLCASYREGGRPAYRIRRALKRYEREKAPTGAAHARGVG